MNTIRGKKRELLTPSSKTHDKMEFIWPIGKGKGIATVEGELVCEAELIFAFGD